MLELSDERKSIMNGRMVMTWSRYNNIEEQLSHAEFWVCE